MFIVAEWPEGSKMKKLRRKPNPSVSWLNLNKACNNRCGWCYAQGTDFKDKVLPLGLAQKLIGLLGELGVGRAILLGGEPTLYAHLPEIIKMLLAANVQPGLVSNGRRFADENYARLIADTGLKGVGFSIKAANKEQYKELTGRDGYDELMKGYNNLRKLGLHVPFSVTLVKGIFTTFPELIQNLVKEGVSRVSIDMGNPIIYKGAIRADGIASPTELAQAVGEHFDILESSSIEFDIFSSIPLCLLPEKAKKSLMEQGRLMTCCHAQIQAGLIFDQEGYVLPCNEFSEFPLGKFGEDFSDLEGFEEFWNGKEIRDFNETFLRYPTKHCASCEDWAICGGGCPTRWLYWDPNEFIKGKEVMK